MYRYVVLCEIEKREREKSRSNLLRLLLEETNDVIFSSKDSNFSLIWVKAVSIFLLWSRLTALLFPFTINVWVLPFDDTKSTTKTTKYIQPWAFILATHCLRVALPFRVMKCEIQKSSVVAQHCIVASFGSCFAFFIFRDQFVAQQKHLLRLKNVVAKSTCTDLLGTAASCSRKEKDGKHRPKTCNEAMLCDIFRVFVSRISPPFWYETSWSHERQPEVISKQKVTSRVLSNDGRQNWGFAAKTREDK